MPPRDPTEITDIGTESPCPIINEAPRRKRIEKTNKESDFFVGEEMEGRRTEDLEKCG